MEQKKLISVLIGLKWEQRYRRHPTDKAVSRFFCSPYHHLDPDFAKSLKMYAFAGSNVLEVGCGYGEQSVALAKQTDLSVHAMDVSETALKQARQNANREKVEVNFIHNNILFAKPDKEFAAVFDRGCFTTIPHKVRDRYVQKISTMLASEGYLFLKVNGAASEEIVVQRFEVFFKLRQHYKTVYQSLDDSDLIAKYFVFQKLPKPKNT